MAVISVSIPELMSLELDALIKRGHYENKSEILRDAIRALFATNRSLRIAAAVELYSANVITLGKAAEIASVTIEEMKNILFSQDIHIEGRTNSIRDLEREIAELRERLEQIEAKKGK